MLKACLNGNLGDDLFVITILERYKNIQNWWFDILVYDIDVYAYLKARYKNVRLIRYPAPPLWGKVLAKLGECIFHNEALKKWCYRKAYNALFIKEYDVFINVGGSLMAEYEGEQFVLGNWLEILFAEHIHAKRKYLLNVNFSGRISKKFEEFCIQVFSHYDDVCFRDAYSQNLFKNSVSCRVAPDMVLNMPCDHNEKTDFKYKKHIGINVLYLAENKRLLFQRKNFVAAYEDALIAVAMHFLQKGWCVFLLGFDNCAAEKAYIARFAEKIKKTTSCTGDLLRVCTYTLKDYQSMLKTISDCDGMITTRFHAMILSIIYGVPFYPIVYDEKIKNFLIDAGYTGRMREINNLTDKEVIIDEIIETFELQKVHKVTVKKQCDAVFSSVDKQFFTDGGIA